MAREGNEFKLSEQEKWIPTISADNEQHVLLYKKLLVASQEILMCKDGNRSACVLYVLQNFQGKKNHLRTKPTCELRCLHWNHCTGNETF